MFTSSTPRSLVPLLRQAVAITLLAATTGLAQAEVSLSHLFAPHMVLQRSHVIPVWGTARAGEAIHISLNTQPSTIVTTQADSAGNWRVQLPALPAGGPYRLSVQGDNSIVLDDVWLGDVWLAAGQSNMEWTVGQSDNAQQAIAQGDQPLIRHTKIDKTVSFTPAADVPPVVWQVSSPETVAQFSGVGYFFAKQLQQAQGVASKGIAIGIINTSWGGTNIETWISRRALASHPEYHIEAMPSDIEAYKAHYSATMQAMATRWQGRPWVAGDSSRYHALDFDDSTWPQLHAPQSWEEQGLAYLDGVLWYRKSVELTAAQASSTTTLNLGTVDDCDETWLNGQRLGGVCGWDVPRHYSIPSGLLHAGKNVIAVRVTDTGGGGGFYGDKAAMQIELGSEQISLAGEWRAQIESFMDKNQLAPNDLPTVAFNAMISPLKDFPIKGVIWYQGESNVERARQYASSFPLMIADWRAQWQQPDLPFYFVQLASFLPLVHNTLRGSRWAELREAQRLTNLHVAHTGMAVATDVGDANDIHPRNKQTVGTRLALLARKYTYGERQLVASGPSYRAMRRQGSRIELMFDNIGTGLVSQPSRSPLQGFSIADASQQFVRAQAIIRGNKVIVWSAAVSHPVAVRYGWVDNPQEDNLFNQNGLPASPFRTDDWPWLTDAQQYHY